MTVLDELRFRISCVRAKHCAGTGWAEVHSLDLFAEIEAKNRLLAVQPLEKGDDRTEFDELRGVIKEARELVAGCRGGCK